MRIVLFICFLIWLFGCSSFDRHNKDSLSDKKRVSKYNKEYYKKNREKLKLRARERYRRNKKN
ncbi:hypothetical protein OY14_04510 (plasmid) [Borreliella chilensis]|uniref:Lipoprotein n=1 Tax=Borreliella chilensis TaxID=1245910 RepID=A0A0A7UWS1_9SPIR|nr:hypothetical protein OY14_04510 [Borreliella chilensis]